MSDDKKRSMVELEIVMKSGATTSVHVDDFTITKGVLDGGISKIEWTFSEPVPGRRRSVYVCLDEVAAIIEVLPEGWEPDDEDAA